MDGFAVRAAGHAGTLPVVVRIAAGRPAPRALEPGEAMGIATGGVVPDGADAVVPIEVVVDCGRQDRVAELLRARRHVRPRGGDVDGRRGRARGRGALLGPARIGALAAAGVGEVRCCAAAARGRADAPARSCARPASRSGRARSTSRTARCSRRCSPAPGPRSSGSSPVADDDDAHRDALEPALEADVLVSSGGVSVGPHDLVRKVAPSWASRRCSGASRSGRASRVAFGVRGAHARLRAAREPRLDARRVRALRPPGAAGAAGRGRPGPALRCSGRWPRRCAGTPAATSSSRARSSRRRGRAALVPLRARSRT